jgi:hypoxanthine phosphoribosyltransferase
LKAERGPEAAVIDRKHTLTQVLTPEQIEDRVAELGKQLSRDLAGGLEPVLLGVLSGSVVFLSDLMRHLDIPVQVDFCRVASYGDSTESSGQVTMSLDCQLDLDGRTLVVVEDIVDTGLTLRWLAERLRRKGPREVKLCALIDKPERREVDLELDYVGFHVPRGFLVGYGLDYNQQYRHLPGVAELHFSG